MGIELPTDIIAYLVLFKFPPSMQNMKTQIMHSTANMKIETVLDHLTQHKNEISGQESQNKPVNTALYNGPRCENGKHNPAVTTHPANSCWAEFPELKPSHLHNQGKKGKKKTEEEAHYYSFFCRMTSNDQSDSPSNRFILNSGCSIHMIVNRSRFQSISTSDDKGAIQTGKKDSNLQIKGLGTALRPSLKLNVLLSNSAWVPDARVNLILLGALVKKGASLRVNSSNSPCSFSLVFHGKTLFVGKVLNNLFVIDMDRKINQGLYSNNDLHEIHRTLGHASLGPMEKFLNKSISTKDKEAFECLDCDRSKIKKSPFPQTQEPAKKDFDRIHIDLMGPLNPTAKGGYRFALNLINSFTGYITCFPLRSKDETSSTLIFIMENEYRKNQRYPSEVCSDGGGEFVNNKLS